MTNSMSRDTILKPKKHTYLLRAEWHATAKLFRVVAKDEDAAFWKAAKKEGRGCLKLSLIREIP